MSDIFALAVLNAKVVVAGSHNELCEGITGRVTRVTRLPKRTDGSMPTYVELEHDGGKLIVSTRHLRLAGPTAVAAE